MNLFPKILWRMPDENVYLTFDDGPDENITLSLLDLLKRYQAKATFFVIGEKAELHPEIVLQIHKNGHVVGNHSYTHPHLIFKAKQKVEKEIKQTDKILFEITGKHPTLFRPPHGQFGLAVLSVLKSTKQKMVLWSVSSQDYKVGASTANVQSRLRKCIQPGKIVLMHDGHPKSPHMLRSLENTLEELKGCAFKFSALPD